MVTTAALAVMLYSGAVTMVGIVLRLLAAPGSRLRAAGLRLMVLFGVFAGTALYVWADLGPDVDARLAGTGSPAIPAAPRMIDV